MAQRQSLATQLGTANASIGLNLITKANIRPTCIPACGLQLIGTQAQPTKIRL